MAETTNSRMSITQLIFIPSVITLGVTLLRLVGELQNWPSALFNREAGGAGSIVGITWLALFFGVYFALKLERAGDSPKSAAKVIGYAFLGLVVTLVGGYVYGMTAEFAGKEFIGLILIIAGGLTPFMGWKQLSKVLLAYGYAARIPVLIVMYFAMRGDWKTHYDAMPPPPFPQDLPFWTKFIRFAVLPQMISWIAFTIIMGSLFGGVAIAVARRKKPAAQPA